MSSKHKHEKNGWFKAGKKANKRPATSPLEKGKACVARHESGPSVQSDHLTSTASTRAPAVTVSEALANVNNLLHEESRFTNMDNIRSPPQSQTALFQHAGDIPLQPPNPVGYPTMTANQPVYAQSCATQPGMYPRQVGAPVGYSQQQQLSEQIGHVISAISSLEIKMETRFTDINNRLEKLDRVENRVIGVEKELKAVWAEVATRIKSVEDKLINMEDRADSVDFTVGEVEDRVHQLQVENRKLREGLIDMQARSMRDNLIFKGVPESETETAEDIEITLKKIFTDQLHLAQELVDQLKFERVHRFGSPVFKPRRIVARFTSFKDREAVRRNANKLKGSDIYISEQFPPEVMEERRKLWPEFKRCKEQNIPCRLTFDKLFIRGQRYFPKG
jgi:hypothetical protein